MKITRLFFLLCIAFCLVCSISKGAEPENKQIIFLSTPDYFDLRKVDLFLNANGIPTALVGGRAMFNILDDFLDTEPFLSILPESVRPEVIVCSPIDDPVFKQGRTIGKMRADGAKTLVEMPDENYMIYPTLARAVYVARPNGDKTDVFLLNTDNLESVKLFSCPFKIGSIAGDGNTTFGMSDNAVYYFIKDQMVQVAESPKPVTSIAVCSPGLFFSTADGVYLIKGEELMQVYDKGTAKLLGVGDILYLLDDEGPFFKLNGISDMTETTTN